jgi:hypothetical protein
MEVLLYGVIAGTVIAFVLNKLMADKLENKSRRIGLKITGFIGCIVFCLCFLAAGSLRKALDNFLEDKIRIIKISISVLFPDVNKMEIDIYSNEFVSISDQLQQITANIDIGDSGVLESYIYKTFSKKLIEYVDMTQRGVVGNYLAKLSDNGVISINSFLYSLKNTAIRTVSPFILIVQIIIIILFLIFLGIYAGIYSLFKTQVKKT